MSDYLLTVSGKSLSGKTTLAGWLAQSADFVEIISHTTRPKRPNEVDGVDYYFVTNEVFGSIPMYGGTEISGNLYGTSVAELVAKTSIVDKIPYAVVDPIGAKFLGTWCTDNGKNHVAVWREISAIRQSKRWFHRTSQNIAHLEGHIQRLMTMRTTELEWPSAFNWNITLKEQTMADALPMVNQVRSALALPPVVSVAVDPAPFVEAT